jgi:hypothetical protein
MRKSFQPWPRGELVIGPNGAYPTAAAPGLCYNNGFARLFWPDEKTQMVMFSDLPDPNNNKWTASQPINAAAGTSFQPNVANIAGNSSVAFDTDSQVMVTSGATAPWPSATRVPGASPAAAPGICCSRSGQIYCVWATGSATKNVYYSTQAWSAPSEVTEINSSAAPAAVVFNGTLYVIAANSDGAHPVYATYLDSGGWSTAQAIGSNAASGVSACVVSKGATDTAIFVFWQSLSDNSIQYTFSSDGKSWQPSAAINDYDTTSDTPAAAVGYDPQGNPWVMVSWKSNDPGNGMWWSSLQVS